MAVGLIADCFRAHPKQSENSRDPNSQKHQENKVKQSQNSLGNIDRNSETAPYRGGETVSSPSRAYPFISRGSGFAPLGLRYARPLHLGRDDARSAPR